MGFLHLGPRLIVPASLKLQHFLKVFFKIKDLDSWKLSVRKSKARDGEGELVPKTIIYVQVEPDLICISLEPRGPLEMLNF